jgi:hypothetical protein
MVKITRKSGLTKVIHVREIPLTEEAFEEGMRLYSKGALIQDAFPTLSAADREFVLTGITTEEWDHAFGPAEE